MPGDFVNNSQTYQIDRTKIIFEQFDDETVLVNTDSGYYYSLSPSGSEILHLLENGCAAGDLVPSLFGNSAEMCQQQIAINSFIERLIGESILVERSPDEHKHANGEQGTPLYGHGSDYAPPLLERFDDVRDLLLIDPIHQVDQEYGWPKAKVNE
jgi:hypothetical protein